MSSDTPTPRCAPAVAAAMDLATAGFTCARLQDSAKALAQHAAMKNGDIYSEVAAKVLAAEVLRLRASASLRDAALERVNLLTTGNGVNANPYETIVEAHQVSNDALSQNNQARRTAGQKD